MRTPVAFMFGVLVGLVAACAAGRGTSVVGRLTEAGTHWPLPAAVVVLFLEDTVIGERADTLGRFRLSVGPRSGCFRLAARHIGMGPALANVRLHPGRETDVGELQLLPAAIPETGALFWKFCRMSPDTVSYYAGVTTIVDSGQ